MDVTVALAIIAIILTFPTTVVALRDLWPRKQSQVNTVSADVEPTAKTQASGDRVLITLNPKNAGTPGTIEHDFATFEELLPTRYRTYFLTYPWSTEFTAKSDMKSDKHFMAFLGTVIGASILYGLLVQPHRWEQILAIAISVLVPSVGCVAVYRSYLQAKSGLAAVNAYYAYLERNEIKIGTEFTQSRAKHGKASTDAERAVARL